MTLAEVRPLLADLGDLKRIRLGGRRGSLAEQAFRRGWSRLVARERATEVALSETAVAIAAVRLAGIDANVLLGIGLDPLPVLRRSYAEVAERVPAGIRERLLAALDDPPVGHHDEPPPFVHLLIEQPRAGPATLGRPPLIPEPTDSHGDHCFTVALYGTLLADSFGADPGEAFALGLAHHLHNAVLPDAGFAGEELLGPALPDVVRRLTEEMLAELPHRLADWLRPLLGVRPDADTALGRAFHAADVLDRVLQIHQYTRAAAFTVDQTLIDLQLVRAGPVQAYQLKILAEAGL